MGSDEGQQASEWMGIDLKCGKTGRGDEMWGVKDILDIGAQNAACIVMCDFRLHSWQISTTA